MKRRKFHSSSATTSTSGGGGDDEDDVTSAKKRKPLSGKVKKGSFEHRFERRRYLNQLVNEFQTSPPSDLEVKRQVLANLANFAYDSYNYHFFSEIGVIPVFMAEISVNRDETLTSFAMAGICNCAADKRLQKEILKNEGLSLVKRHLYSSSVEILMSTLTTLIYLMPNPGGGGGSDPEASTSNLKDVEIALKADLNLMEHINNLSRTHSDQRVINLAKVLLERLM